VLTNVTVSPELYAVGAFLTQDALAVVGKATRSLHEERIRQLFGYLRQIIEYLLTRKTCANADSHGKQAIKILIVSLNWVSQLRNTRYIYNIQHKVLNKTFHLGHSLLSSFHCLLTNSVSNSFRPVCKSISAGLTHFVLYQIL
jgi:hypothetical protein